MKLEFSNIRRTALDYWFEQTLRSRDLKELDDDYSNSTLCYWQNIDDKCHISFLCSLGDWLDNITDILKDERLDNCGPLDSAPLFRYYTKLLLIVSEIIEDFIDLHSSVKGFNRREKDKAGADFSGNFFDETELKCLSDFINSVCKHKANGIHIHNHHLNIYFEDFGAKHSENQIRIGKHNPEISNEETSILIPPLKYFIEVIVKCNSKLNELLSDKEYYERVKEKYGKEYSDSAE